MTDIVFDGVFDCSQIVLFRDFLSLLFALPFKMLTVSQTNKCVQVRTGAWVPVCDGFLVR